MVRNEDKACRAAGIECVTKVWRLIRRQTLLLLLSVTIAGSALQSRMHSPHEHACVELVRHLGAGKCKRGRTERNPR